MGQPADPPLKRGISCRGQAAAIPACPVAAIV